jgi:hypothetical protein
MNQATQKPNSKKAQINWSLCQWDKFQNLGTSFADHSTKVDPTYVYFYLYQNLTTDIPNYRSIYEFL